MINKITIKERFDFELGGSVSEVPIAYTTYGELNSDRSNVIMVCHGLTANSDVMDWWSGIYGIGKPLDPDRYFIICINNLGSPYGTISPATISPETGRRYGMDFPKYTTRDAARVHLMLLDYLKIDSILLTISGSCGGNISQEIAYLVGDRIQNLALVCCSPQEMPWAIGIHEGQRMAMRGDATLYDDSPQAGQAGMRSSRAFALSFYRTPELFNLRQAEDTDEKVDDFKVSSYFRYQGDKFVERYDAQCYYQQLDFLDTHNMARGRDSMATALGQIKAKTLCIGLSSDLLAPVSEQKRLAKFIPDAKYVEIETICGHDGFLIETEKLTEILFSYFPFFEV